MLAYKVVEKVTRKGSNWMLAKKKFYLRSHLQEFSFPTEIMKKHLEFYPSYPRDILF